MDDLAAKTDELRTIEEVLPAATEEFAGFFQTLRPQLDIFRGDPVGIARLRAAFVARCAAYDRAMANLPNDDHQRLVAKAGIVQSMMADLQSMVNSHAERQAEVNDLSRRMEAGRTNRLSL